MDTDLLQDIECKIGLHNWSNWETIEKGEITRHKDIERALGLQPKTIGFYENQRRLCSNCGMSKLRTTSTRMIE